MKRSVYIQDKITSLRAPAGVMLLLLSLVGCLFLILTGPTLHLAWNHQIKGRISDFPALIEGGIGSHHFQAADLFGWVSYDQRLDLIGEHNTVEDRFVLLRDEATQTVLLIKINKLYAIRAGQYANVSGILRRMDKEKSERFMQKYMAEIQAVQAEGYSLDPHYYLNEYERLPGAETIRTMLIFAAINCGLILIFLIPFLVPHPVTLPKGFGQKIQTKL
jgi:hypothetical protein